jgi:uncharacterized protein
MPGKFVIKKGTTGKFRFSLHSSNGEIIATSESYNSKAAAQKGIASVKRFAADAVIEDATVAKKAAPTARAANKRGTAKKAAGRRTARSASG